jgi:hypothetical protein
MVINMNGKLENLLSLNRGDSSIPAELNLRGDGLLADFKGDLSVLDEKVRVGGSVAIQVNPMNTWAKLLGVDWPYAKPLSVSTELDYQPDRLSMQNVKIASTGVKAKGKISFAADASPKLQINVNEGIIDLAEFINPIDEEIDSSSVAEKSKKVDKDRVIPDFSLESELIESMDAQIRIDSIEVMSRGEQITKLNGKVGCTNGILSFSPLKGQSSVGSKTTVEMTWDTTPQPSKATLSWKTKDIDYGLIIKKLGIRDDIVGKLDLKLNVEGQGLTLREILSSTNGEMEILFGKGHTPRHALEFWGDELLRLLIPTNWIKADITDLNCAVGRFDIRNGVIKSNVLLMDTRRITVVGEIGVDLKTEEISGLFEPKNKQAALLRLGTPIKLGGTMANITAEPAGSRVVFLGKMLLGLTHPSTLLLLFGDLGTAEKNPCKELLEKLSSEDLETVSP